MTVRSIALITSLAASVPNFRGALIEALVRSGVRVDALAPDYTAALKERTRALGAEPIDFSLERTGMRPLRDLADMVRLSFMLRRLKPAATLCYFVKPVIYGGLAAALAGVPRRYAMVEGLGYVFTEADSPSLRKTLIRAIVMVLFFLAFRAAHKVIFLNPDDRGEMLRRRLLPPGKALMLGGIGVDLDAFAPAPLPPAPVSFVMVGRILREKGVEEFAAAAEIVARSHPQCRFVLVGGTDANPGAIPLGRVEGWTKAGVLTWAGEAADVRPWIAGAAVFVLPSYREGVPRSTQEAMAMGRAVITTDVPGCRETVVDGLNGLLVPARDAKALAAAMLKLAENPGLTEAMGRESRRLAEERFDVHKINRTLLGELGVAPPPETVPA